MILDATTAPKLHAGAHDLWPPLLLDDDRTYWARVANSALELCFNHPTHASCCMRRRECRRAQMGKDDKVPQPPPLRYVHYELLDLPCNVLSS